MAALAPLVVALCGAGLAYLWVYVAVWLPVGLVLAGILLGLGLFRAGRGKIKESPVSGLKFMEWRFLFPGALAAAGAGAVIVIAATLAVQDDWSDEAKGIVGAISGAIGVFISALVVDSAKTADSVWLAEPIKKAFEREFQDAFPKNSEAWLALYSLQGGWGRAKRRERAKKVAAGLAAST